jgi:hypothetical protein
LASTDLLALVMVDELGKLINSTPLDRGIKRDFLFFSNLSLFPGRTEYLSYTKSCLKDLGEWEVGRRDWVFKAGLGLITLLKTDLVL